MASIREQVCERLQAILDGTLTGNPKAYLSRAVPLSRDQAPAIVVMPADEDTDALSDNDDKSVLMVDVEYMVRGDPWPALADALAAQAHPLIVGDAQLQTLCFRIRRDKAKWEDHEADATAGKLTQTYRFRYTNPFNSL